MTFKLYDSVIRLVKGTLPEAVPFGHRGLRAHDDGWYDHDAADSIGVLLANQDSLSFDNLIHNASLDIWNEGTSFVSPASATYLAEGWRIDYVTSGLVTVTRDTDVPTPSGGHGGFAKTNYSLKVDVTTADAAVAAGDFLTLSHRIEGYVFNGVAQRKMVVSIPVKTDRSGGATICLSVRNNGSDRSWVKEFVVPAGVHTKLEMPIDPSPVAGTWNYLNALGLQVSICLMAGSNFQTTQETWQTGNFFATANQSNILDNVANNLWFGQPKLEPGDKATIFVPEPFSENLLRCYRYYYKTFPHETTPGLLTTGYMTGIGFSTIAIFASVRFPIEMRATPTIILRSPDTGASGKVRDITAAADLGTGAIAALDLNATGYGGVLDTGAPFTVGNHHRWHYTAIARL